MKRSTIIKTVASVIILGLLVIVAFAGCTAKWERDMKSMSSNWNGGLNRTVSVYSYDGTLIKSWTGKFDVSDSENEMYFDADGKRVIIQGGIIINEEN